jgi:hypothetical protein
LRNCGVEARVVLRGVGVGVLEEAVVPIPLLVAVLETSFGSFGLIGMVLIAMPDMSKTLLEQLPEIVRAEKRQARGSWKD